MESDMHIPPVETEQQHRRALELVSELMENDPDPESKEGQALSSLLTLIRNYEEEHDAVSSPEPIEVIRFHMDRLNLTQAELHRETGIAESHLSEILNGKRDLSKRHIRMLSSYFDIPADHLFRVRNAEDGDGPAPAVAG